MLTPRWIAIEGPDGSGKSSQAAALVRRLHDVGAGAVQTREPGGAPNIGAEIRSFLFDGNRIETLSAEQQVLFFQADRAATYETVILPALAAGQWVVSDRGPFGTEVYQSVLQGVPTAQVRLLTDWATRGNRPHLTIVLDVEPSVAVERIRLRSSGVGWSDTWSESKFRKVREAYAALAEEYAARCVLIDAGLPAPAVEAVIWDSIVRRFDLSQPIL